MIRQELDVAFLRWIHRPGQHLGVYDNAGDYLECRRRVHCNSTHGDVYPEIEYETSTKTYRVNIESMQEKLDAFNNLEKGRRKTIIMAGDHNNVYFPDFIKYKRTLPQALMQDIEGKYIELIDPLICKGQGIPMPAIDDWTIIRLNKQALGIQAKALKDNQCNIAYVLGFEMLYPEYFNLTEGDFREASWKHFKAWLKKEGIAHAPLKEEVNVAHMSQPVFQWRRFREQAMADRCSHYYQAVLSEDEDKPIYYPNHGSIITGDRRWKLAQQPASILGSVDGLEMGHILVADDKERRNVILLSHFTAFGAPVIVPRLGNKHPDLSAIGGGKSFSKESLRRYVYECLGFGIDKIFPIHWTSTLHDGEWFIKDTDAQAECRKVFDEIQYATPYLKGMGRWQPQVGLLASDAQWLERWNPQWTGIMQNALEQQCALTILSDQHIDDLLVQKIRLMVLVNVDIVFEETANRIIAYMDAGGKVLVYGMLAQSLVQEKIIGHENFTHYEKVELADETLLVESFLAGPKFGVDMVQTNYRPVHSKLLFSYINKNYAEILLKPILLSSESDLSSVNAYTLTNRENIAIVLINLSNKQKRFTLKVDKRLLDNVTLFDVIENQDSTDEIVLSPYGTKIIYAKKRYKNAEVQNIIRRAKNGFERWQALGGDIEALRLHYVEMLNAETKELQVTHAKILMNSLVIVTKTVDTSTGLKIICAVYDNEGQMLKDVTVSLRLIPDEFKRYRLKEENGNYIFIIKKEVLPKMYNMERYSYESIHGKMRVILSAETNEAVGGSMLAIDI